MINILDSPFSIKSEICSNILEKGLDINTRLMLEWSVQLVCILLGTYGVEYLKQLFS